MVVLVGRYDLGTEFYRLQYVLHPNTDRAIKNALVASLRFEIAF